jgi:hypothetical protein
MRRYRFFLEGPLPESLMQDKVVLGLVAKMQAADIVAVLIKDIGLTPTAAAQAAGALISQADAGMPKTETSSIMPVDISATEFPNQPQPENDDWPYDGQTIAVMKKSRDQPAI